MSSTGSPVIPALIASLAIATPAAAQALVTRVYEGSLGQSPVVLEVVESVSSGGEVASAVGRYFYRKHHISIPLLSARAGSDLILNEVDPACIDDPAKCAVKATFRLQASGPGLSGHWSGGGKSFPVSLTQVETAKGGGAGLASVQDMLQALPLLEDADLSDPYLRRQIVGETLHSKEVLRHGVGTVTATDRLTGIHYVRLSRLADADAMARTNRLLDQRRHQMVAWGLSCRETAPADSPSAGSLGDWESYESEVIYASTSLLVVRERGSTFCNNAYPNNTFDYSVYDLRHGEVLDFNRILRLTSDKVDDEGEGVRTTNYAALLKKLTPRSPYALNARTVDRECLSPDLREEGYTLSFNEKGLVFSLTDLPHAMGACMDDYYQVPYRDLKGLWTAEARAYFPEARAPNSTF